MQKQYFSFSQLALAFLVASTALTSAAYAVDVPSSADPTKAIKRFEPTPRSGLAPAPTVLQPAAPATTPQAAQQVFTLGKVVVEGVTVYPAGAFDDLSPARPGSKVSVAQIQTMAARIAARYRADGYILARAYVPTQSVGKNGDITIRVIEGSVNNIFFEGDAPSSALRNLSADYANQIKAQQPLKSDMLERYLLLINDLPGYHAQAVLRPTPGAMGQTDIIILLNRKNVDALLSTDNRGSRYLGAWQTQATVSTNDLFGLDERTTLRGIVSSPTEELRFGSLAQEYRVGSEGTTVKLEGSYAKTVPGQELDDTLQVRGKTSYAAATVTHPVIRSRLENLNVRGSLDMRNSTTDVFVTTRQSNDRIRSARLGAAYDVADEWKGVNLVDFQASQGIDGLGATETGGATRTRISGEQDYTKFNLDAVRTQALPNNFSLVLSASGQYSLDPLLASEQFQLGGPSFGTAYDPGELSGDHGAAAKAELRYGNVLDTPYMPSYQFYGYYDIGSVWLKEPLTTEENRESLASAGIGVRTNFAYNIAGNLELSYPLTKRLSDYGDHRGRVFTGLSIKY